MRYRPAGKENVLIFKGGKRVFYGMRTVYTKDYSGRTYIRYKNRYYRAHYYGRNHYEVYIR